MANELKFGGGIDFQKYALLNIVITKLSEAPATPVEGQIYENTTDHKLYYYNGTTWVDLTALGSSYTEGNGIDITAGVITSVGKSNEIAVTADGIGIDANFSDRFSKHKHAANVGNGSDADITVTHSLNTRDIAVFVRDNSSPYNWLPTPFDATTVDTCTLHFGSAPTSNQYRVIIVG